MESEVLCEAVAREALRVATAFEVRSWQTSEEAPKEFVANSNSVLFAGVNEMGDTITWQITRDGDLQSVQINGFWLIWRSQAFRHMPGAYPNPELRDELNEQALRFIQESRPLFRARKKALTDAQKIAGETEEKIVCGVALNKRQQKFLYRIFDHDQMAEQEQKDAWHAGRHRQTASVWRWMTYNPYEIYGLIRDFRGDKLSDPGTGATFKALKQKGLIELHHPSLEFPNIVNIKLTTKGRKVARQLFPDYENPLNY